MQAARGIAGYFNSSTQAAAALEQMCRALGIKPRRVMQDIVTRWWSTYSMLMSMLYLKKALIALAAKEVEPLPEEFILTAAQWRQVACGVGVLEPLMQAQRMLEGQLYVTNSLCIAIAFDLRAGLEKAVEKGQQEIDGELGAEAAPDSLLYVATAMLKAFNQKWGDGTDVCIAGEGPRRQPRGFTRYQVLNFLCREQLLYA